MFRFVGVYARRGKLIMSDIEKTASQILETLCTACQKTIGCCIRDDGMRPGLDDLGLPEEWTHGYCAEYLAVDTDTMDLF